MPGPLDGCRVIDLAMYVAGPLATLVLAEQGADVIKIEPVTGEVFRYGASSRAGFSAWWMATNRNKKSVALNIKHPEGAEILWKLIATADVFVHQFRPGVIERLGFGWEDVFPRNQRLIYAEISGFGRTGPLASRRAYDNVIQSFVGLPAVQGWNRPEGPQSIRTPVADKVAPLILAQAITASLFEREKSGLGQHIDVSMLHALLWWMWGDMYTNDTFLDQTGIEQGANIREMGNLLFPTSDGHITVTFATDGEWRAIATALDKPEWITDQDLGDGVWRDVNRGKVFELLARSFESRSTAEWSERLEAADAPFAPVHDPSDVLKHPQVTELGMTTVLEHPIAGPHLQPTHPALFSRSQDVSKPAPTLGADTESVLSDLGYGAEPISDLVKRGVVRTAEIQAKDGEAKATLETESTCSEHNGRFAGPRAE